ncbi:MAG TPA: hypothetical protein VKA60_04720 [Blastocatellia bacterium]|nr:hypothetical protein [Blastocatellia bacterium]
MVMGLMMIINQAVDGGKENQWPVASGQWSVENNTPPLTSGHWPLATGHY